MAKCKLLIIPATLDSVAFDATIQESHASTATIPTHPVEQGADIADHVRVGLDQFTAEAFVTNTPIDVPDTQMDGVTGGVSGMDLDVPAPPLSLPIAIPGAGAIGAALGIKNPAPQQRANVLNFSGDFDRVTAVYTALQAIVEAAELCEIATGLRYYSNMVISQLTAPRNAESGGGVTFSFQATQIRIVETKTVAAPKIPASGSASKVNKGVQTPKDATPPQQASTWYNATH